MKRGLFGGGKAYIDITGQASSVRFKGDQKIEFVVQLPNGVDTTAIELLRLEAKDGNRRLLIMEGGRFSGLSEQKLAATAPIQLNVSRYGQYSYKIVAANELTPGEYCFGTKRAEVYCFGVDAVVAK